MQRRSHRSHRSRPMTSAAVAAALGWGLAGCGDPVAAPVDGSSDTLDASDTSDTSDRPTTSRFRGVVVADDLSPRGIARATVRRFDDPDQAPLTTDEFGFFEADVPNDKPVTWVITADGFITTIAVMSTWYADSDTHYQLRLRSPARLADLYAKVVATGAPEPSPGRAHVEVRGLYPTLRGWAGGMTVTAESPAIYPPWLEDAPAEPRTRAHDALPVAWLPNVDPAAETVTFTVQDRFGNGCGADAGGDGTEPITVPVRADATTIVDAFCRFPLGQRPVFGQVTIPAIDDFVYPPPAVGVEVCVRDESACATSDVDGSFQLVAADGPLVTLRAEAENELPVLWPIARPREGSFDARHLFTDSGRTADEWPLRFTTDGVAEPFGAEADILVNIEMPVGDLVVQADGAEMMPFYHRDNFDEATGVRTPGSGWFHRIPESVIEDGFVTVLLTLPVPEECRSEPWYEAFFESPVRMKVPADAGHLTYLPWMGCE